MKTLAELAMRDPFALACAIVDNYNKAYFRLRDKTADLTADELDALLSSDKVIQAIERELENLPE
jgi:hypothetical protein